MKIINRFVKNKKNGKVYYVSNESRNKARCYVKGADGEIDYEKASYFFTKDLLVLKPYRINLSDAKKIVSFDCKISDIAPEDNYKYNYVFHDKINSELDLLYKALTNFIKGVSCEDYFEWYEIITDSFGIDDGRKKSKCEYSYDTVFSFVNSELWDIFCYAEESEGIINQKMFYNAYETIKWYLDNKPSFKEPCRCTGYIEHLISIYNEDTINNAPLKEQKFYKKCIEYLVNKNNEKALRTKGYAMYCNSKIYPTNWKECTKIFLKLYKLYGNPYYANTLGYIYYYGRNTNFKPDYEKAFKYFSIGASAGIFESMYKIGDMFKHGYAVTKNNDIAYKLYSMIEKESALSFIEGGYSGSKYADITLRLGDAYETGRGVEADNKTAYYYYLLSLFALETRRKEHNFGDDKVYNGIKESIRRVKHTVEHMPYISTLDNSLSFNNFIYNDILPLEASFVKENKRYVLTINTLDKSPFIVSVPEFDYSSFMKKVVLKTSNNSKMHVVNKKKTFAFNRISEEDDSFIFLLNNVEVACLETDYIRFDKPKKKK